MLHLEDHLIQCSVSKSPLSPHGNSLERIRRYGYAGLSSPCSCSCDRSTNAFAAQTGRARKVTACTTCAVERRESPSNVSVKPRFGGTKNRVPRRSSILPCDFTTSLHYVQRSSRPIRATFTQTHLPLLQFLDFRRNVDVRAHRPGRARGLAGTLCCNSPQSRANHFSFFPFAPECYWRARDVHAGRQARRDTAREMISVDDLKTCSNTHRLAIRES